MVYTTIKHSLLTRSTTTVVSKPYVDSVKSAWYDACKGFHTGVSIQAKQLYTALQGTIIGINREKHITVTIQYDANHVMSYGNLITTELKLNQAVSQGVYIGDVDREALVEYWVRSRRSNFAVRFGTETYYKIDPLPLLKQCVYQK